MFTWKVEDTHHLLNKKVEKKVEDTHHLLNYFPTLLCAEVDGCPDFHEKGSDPLSGGSFNKAEKRVSVAISVGVAERSVRGETPEDVLKKA